jgi:CRISPR-associated protein Csb3
MSIFHPAGSVTSALTHFALYGLAAIVEDETGQSVQLYWTDESNPKPQLDTGQEPEVIAAMVHRHAARHASPESWLAVRVNHEERDTAAFSPRIKKPSTPQSWRQLQGARHAGLDAVVSSRGWLDMRMIGALGEPAYWPNGKEDTDAGASRWEMKTRNQGAEFVGNRLVPLAQSVAARTTDQTLTGLTGETVNDEAGSNKPDSRSGTGFARPGPVDNALAWCALWGISQFPVVHHNGAQSTTAGTHVPGVSKYATYVFLPVPTRPITSSRLRTILTSRQLPLAVTTENTEGPLDVIVADAARKWLTERSIRALMRFPVDLSDNANAREIQIRDGSVVALTGSRL